MIISKFLLYFIFIYNIYLILTQLAVYSNNNTNIYPRLEKQASPDVAGLSPLSSLYIFRAHLKRPYRSVGMWSQKFKTRKPLPWVHSALLSLGVSGLNRAWTFSLLVEYGSKIVSPIEICNDCNRSDLCFIWYWTGLSVIRPALIFFDFQYDAIR